MVCFSGDFTFATDINIIKEIKGDVKKIVGSNPIWGSDFFCVLSCLILYISLYFLYDFTFRINILNSISTSHKHSFFIITNVLSVSRDLPQPFLTFYFNPNLHHFINNTCNLIHFLSMTIDTKFMELIGVFSNYLRFVNYNVSC